MGKRFYVVKLDSSGNEVKRETFMTRDDAYGFFRTCNKNVWTGVFKGEAR